MNVLTVLDQPALPVELSATLELAADFAKASKGPATQAAYGSDCRNRRAAPRSGRHPGGRLMPSSTWARGAARIGGTRPTDHCSRLVANHETHSSTFWK
jgi:hypothetical protein